jgi:hypothetical protein
VSDDQQNAIDRAIDAFFLQRPRRQKVAMVIGRAMKEALGARAFSDQVEFG